MKKLSLIFVALFCVAVGYADDVTTTFVGNATGVKYTAGQTLNCAEGGLSWVTSGLPNGCEVVNNARGIQFSKTSSNLTTTIQGATITKVVVVASSNTAENTIGCTIDGAALGETQTINKSNNEEYTFTSTGASGEIAVLLTSSGETGKSIYVKSITVTYTGGEGGSDDVCFAGSCGENAKFILTNDGLLTIYGTGAMLDNPWRSYSSQIKTVNILDGVSSICDYAFDGCGCLTTVNISNTVANIGRYSFSGCKNLSSIRIPRTVKYIKEKAFEGCENLTYASIGCSYIGEYAFNACGRMTSLSIEETVTVISDNAFHLCRALQKIYNYSNLDIVVGSTDNGGVAYYAQIVLTKPSKKDNYIYCRNGDEILLGGYTGKDTILVLPDNLEGCMYKISDCAFFDCPDITCVFIPSSVTSIGNWAFRACSNLSSVSISYGISGIGAWAFAFCSQLESIVLPNSINKIEDGVFYGCASLCSVDLGESIFSIGKDAFRGCSALTSLAIPNAVTEISENAFYGCRCLCGIKMSENIVMIGKSAFEGCSSLTTLDLPNTITEILDGAFSGCSSLSSISIPELVTVVDNYSFKNCYNLSNVEMANSVKRIGFEAFYGCSKLSTITIPSSVYSIANSAFENCYELHQFICNANTPPSNSNIFYNVPLSTGKLYVPLESLEIYQSTKPWSDWGCIMPIKETAVDALPLFEGLQTKESEVRSYDLSGKLLKKLHKGLVIKGRKKMLIR